ncbi:hypothetical protein AAHB33_17315 [Paenarthrobacter sp. S56]|uniref:hypothetical protein n=1 Tax=Paenarthrobacter sp. S56 TaxID=3138179 RepID=UPI00321B75E6
MTDTAAKTHSPPHDHGLHADAVAQGSEDRFQYHLGDVIQRQDQAECQQVQAEVPGLGPEGSREAVCAESRRETGQVQRAQARHR